MSQLVDMIDSSLNTFAVNLLGDPSGNPATIVKSNPKVLRVVVQNTGPVDIFLAHNSNELTKFGQTSGVYILAPTQSVTLVIKPEQGVFAAAAGANGRISVAISQAVPFFLER